MAFLPVAHIAPNYRDYDGYWIKSYVVGTTTPKPMALKSDGSNQVAKLEIDVNGFLNTSGGALVIPYIDGTYDIWMFPTEAEADDDNTINALLIADGSQGDAGSNLGETIELTDNQTTVVFSEINTATATLFIQKDNTKGGYLFVVADYTITDDSTIELTSSYPNKTLIRAFGFSTTEIGEVTSFNGRVGAINPISDDYNASQIKNTPAGGITSTNQQDVNNELDADIIANKAAVDAALAELSTVIPVIGGGALTALRINEIHDGSTYNLPLAASVAVNQIITITLPDTYSSFTPLVQRVGADTITDSTGSNTDILMNSGSVSFSLTSDGVSVWSF